MTTRALTDAERHSLDERRSELIEWEGRAPVSGSDLSIYGGGAPQGEAEVGGGLMSGFRSRMASLREKVGNRSVFKRQAEGPALAAEQTRLDRVLNSFREDA